MEEARKAAEVQAAQIAANATAQIEAEKAKALSELRKSMGGVATDLAGRIVGESMTDDARAAGRGRPLHRRARTGEPERRAELMIGASRTSLAALREAVNARFDSADAAALAADGQSILSFAALLGHERTLRQTAGRPGLDAGAKRGLLQRLLDGQGRAPAPSTSSSRSSSTRWSTDRDMVDAMDEAGAEPVADVRGEGRPARPGRGGDLPLRPDHRLQPRPADGADATPRWMSDSKSAHHRPNCSSGKADPLTRATAADGHHRTARPTGADRGRRTSALWPRSGVAGSSPRCAPPSRCRDEQSRAAHGRARTHPPPRRPTQRHRRPLHRGWPGGPGRRRSDRRNPFHPYRGGAPPAHPLTKN